MKKLIFVLLLALFFITGCEKLPKDIQEEKSTLKSAEQTCWLVFDQQNIQGTGTLANPAYYSFTNHAPNFMLGFTWQWMGGSDYRGLNFSTGYSTTYSNKIYQAPWSIAGIHEDFLFRFEPELDPDDWEGYIGFLVKGTAGTKLLLGLAIATDGEGDANILANSQQQDDCDWQWCTNDGIYPYTGTGGQVMSAVSTVVMTGHWQFVEYDASNAWWICWATAESGVIDYMPPLVDDAFLVMEACPGIASGPRYFDFIVNGKVSTPTPVVSSSISGPNQVGLNDTETYTFNCYDNLGYHQYYWYCPNGTVQSGQGTSQASIKFTSGGSTEVKCRVKFHQMGWSEYTVKGVSVSTSTPPAPTISGASSCSVTSQQSYTMPSGKQSYEWSLPYGVYSIQQYQNVKVVGFTSTGNKTIQGRYKEGGVWSEWGYKNVYVY